MTQNWTFRNPRINESEKLRLSDMYVPVISCFHSILRLKTKVQGTYALNLPLPRFMDIVPQNVALKIYERNVSSASFRRFYTGN